LLFRDQSDSGKRSGWHEGTKSEARERQHHHQQSGGGRKSYTPQHDGLTAGISHEFGAESVTNYLKLPQKGDNITRAVSPEQGEASVRSLRRIAGLAAVAGSTKQW
jgi:hypothetical protein